ncbi:hypothetical protein VTK73DRAFT_7681 [Phialemonium thermophilum]|uniref:YTH domain-containing protein n=1 Tax=Phialemonium thermophilum TaxID=223376 RepID=A0ABR3Y758_9PEZI
MPQYAGQPGFDHVLDQQYYHPQQQSQIAPYYSIPLSPNQNQTGLLRSGVGYYASPVAMNEQYYYPHAGQLPGPAQSVMGHPPSTQYMPPVPHQRDSRLAHSQIIAEKQRNSNLSPSQILSSARQNIVRGPPRKPRQSGHAIWIGNLPPQTELMTLVQHVCKEASGLESLFLISKSNCAFANFKDEQSCLAAQQKLHDSKFQSVRLVSRLRKSAVEGTSGVSAPTGPGASAAQAGSDVPDGETPHGKSETNQAHTLSAAASDAKSSAGANETVPHRDRFFILKSLTVEDLELSVQTGIWATQSHNEEILNKAFQSADNVYLIFSANKSGEYFGYARMASPVNDDPAAAIEFAPKAQLAPDIDLPKAIPTEATEYAPRGRIIDDSARGTIFWEAEREDATGEGGSAPDGPGEVTSGSNSIVEDGASVRGGADGQSGPDSKAWGKPFKLEWLSTTRLPFYRTRGLRNPWNSNREVKIARDGTEVEPSIGRRLIGLFNRASNMTPSPAGAAPNLPTVLRSAVPVVVGYPPLMLPYQN